MAEAILEKIPAEKRWEIAAKALTGSTVGHWQVLLGVVGKEKLDEISAKLWGESGKTFLPTFKEAFKIPVKDAVDAANLHRVAVITSMGPEYEGEIIEGTERRAVERVTKCPWWERAKELGFTEQFDCVPGATAFSEEGVKAINPKLTFKITKCQPRGDPYCEHVFELKE